VNTDCIIVYLTLQVCGMNTDCIIMYSTRQVCGLNRLYHNIDYIIMYLTAGFGVIDFEKWRPIWRQNWASLLPYQEVSRKIEKRRQPFWWTPKQIEAEVTGSN
jgi:hypothetical protein